MPVGFCARLVAVIVVAAPALAAGPLQVESRLLVEKRVALPDGGVRIDHAPATRTVPGDRVAVIVAYRNTGATALADVAVVNPVPRGLTFGAADTPGLDLSVDGVRFAPLAALTVALPGGGTRPARAADVTAVRWRLARPLAPREGGQFSFHAAVQ